MLAYVAVAFTNFQCDINAFGIISGFDDDGSIISANLSDMNTDLHFFSLICNKLCPN